MKKLLCLLLVILIPVAAIAETDLSSMTYDDLIALNRQIIAEIMNRPEWKEVTVPAGMWIIGQDIPEGYYSIRATGKIAITSSAPEGSQRDDFYHVLGADGEVGKEFFKSGNIFKTSNPVILAPPKGLGF